MGIVPRQRRVATAWTALLVVGAVLVLLDLARVVFGPGPFRPALGPSLR
jgi:hypothetical protein